MNSSAAQHTPIDQLVVMSIKSVAMLLVQYLIGAAIAYLGLVSEADVRSFSGVMNLILIPCLMVTSLGRGLSYEIFIEQRAAQMGIFNPTHNEIRRTW